MDEQTDGHRRGPRAGQILGQMYTETNRYMDRHGHNEKKNRIIEKRIICLTNGWTHEQSIFDFIYIFIIVTYLVCHNILLL